MVFGAKERIECLLKTGNLLEIARLANEAFFKSTRNIAISELEKKGLSYIFHPAKTETRPSGYVSHCIGSDANSNCHAGCNNGDMCSSVPTSYSTEIVEEARYELIKLNKPTKI